MQHVVRSVFAFCCFIATLARPGFALAQAEEDTPSLPTDSKGQVARTPVEQESGAGRFGGGVKLGMTLSSFIDDDGGSEFAEYTPKRALTFGVFGIVSLVGPLSFQADLLYVSKGRQTNLDGMPFSTLDVDYFEVPLLARVDVRIGEHVSPYLAFGPAVGVLWKFQNRLESGGSAMDLTDQAKRFELSGVVGAGIVASARRHGLTLEGRYGRSFTGFLEDEDEDVKNHVFALMLGYQYSRASAATPLPPRDSDGDGIPDQDDECPHDIEDKEGFQDEDGCPDPDNDGDDITDEADKCSLDAEDKDGFQDEDGCPDPDNDGDDIRDEADTCPAEAEDKDEFEDKDGCPDPDNDRDGTPDTDDDCPNKAGDPELRGCPDEDKDKIADQDDLCQNTAGKPELQGCSLVKLSQDGIERPNGGPFGLGKRKALESLLKEVAAVLQKRSDLGKLRITVYVGTKGKGKGQADRAKEKAEKKADEIRSGLTEINSALSERLEAQGESDPRTKADVYRVEFTFIGDGAKQN